MNVYLCVFRGVCVYVYAYAYAYIYYFHIKFQKINLARVMHHCPCMVQIAHAILLHHAMAYKWRQGYTARHHAL